MSLLTSFWRIGIVALLLLYPPIGVVADTLTIPVTTTAELDQALANAQPGQTIALADGVYEGGFTITVDGTATQPITLQGSPAVILAGEVITKGYALHLDGADYWLLTGFTIRNAAKGIMLDNAANNTLDHLTIEQTGQEAVHFRTCSTNNLLQYSTIRETGVITPGFGEGVYIGSDADKWPAYHCDLDLIDKSDDNQILANHFGPYVRAEAIDGKEGTSGGVILNNEFDATGLSGAHFANSWIDIKGNRYKIGYNRGRQGDTTQLLHGFETHVKAGAWGRANIFYGNVLTFNASGYGFHIDDSDLNHGNLVCANNQVSGAGLGITNIALTTAHTPPQLRRAAESALSVARAVAAEHTVWLPLINTFPCD